mmetsp:Transcript_17033/g.64479  ORF Transcript_17033/g.64479 Transcript_17033/m.64479 type:complete len:101 (-) Transcript_17033:2073-2375(-)
MHRSTQFRALKSQGQNRSDAGILGGRGRLQLLLLLAAGHAQRLVQSRPPERYVVAPGPSSSSKATRSPVADAAARVVVVRTVGSRASCAMFSLLYRTLPS